MAKVKTRKRRRPGLPAGITDRPPAVSGSVFPSSSVSRREVEQAIRMCGDDRPVIRTSLEGALQSFGGREWVHRLAFTPEVLDMLDHFRHGVQADTMPKDPLLVRD